MIKRYILAIICCLNFSSVCLAAAAPADEAEAAKQRFVRIAADDEFVYYLDAQSARWIDRPYSKTEQLLDVWIKQAASEPETYSYPESYTLKHYYIRPGRRQLQLMGEIEAAGRPDNNAPQAVYNDSRWAELIPGSTEDKIYQAVLDNTKNLSRKNSGKAASAGDTLDDVLRIAL